MTTKNTLSDLHFAEQYVEFVSRRGSTPETRTRAKIVLATIILLDRVHPTWRAELLTSLHEAETATDIAAIFPIPESFGDDLLGQYIDIINKRR